MKITTAVKREVEKLETLPDPLDAAAKLDALMAELRDAHVLVSAGRDRSAARAHVSGKSFSKIADRLGGSRTLAVKLVTAGRKEL